MLASSLLSAALALPAAAPWPPTATLGSLPAPTALPGAANSDRIADRGPEAQLLLATFDGTTHPKTNHQWSEMSDPVMGGRSHGTWQVKPDPSPFSPLSGNFAGVCAIVPFLHAPGL